MTGLTAGTDRDHVSGARRDEDDFAEDRTARLDDEAAAAEEAEVEGGDQLTIAEADLESVSLPPPPTVDG